MKLRFTAAIFLLSCQAPANTLGVFRDNTCGASFRVPVGWEVVRSKWADEAQPCWFSARPKNWKQLMASNRGVDRFSIDVLLYPHGFANQLPESNFVRQGANWLVAGRQGMRQPAKPINSPHWLGVRGTAIVGCFAEEGGYVGLCPGETVLVGTAKRSAHLFAGAYSTAQFEIILGSLRFLP